MSAVAVRPFPPSPRLAPSLLPGLRDASCTHRDASPAWQMIKGLEKMSFCDWPGRACCVLFLGGCNLACPTCHNARVAWRPGSLPTLPRPMLLEFLTQRARWLDGIVVSGGEATLAPGLEEFLRELQRFKLPVKLDTNGLRPGLIRRLLERELVQAVAMDVKGPFERYPELTGQAVTAQEAAQSLKQMFALAVQFPETFQFRCTQVPLLTAADIEATRRQLPAGFNLTLQPYKDPRRTHAHPDSQTRRPPGNLVSGPCRPGDPQGAACQRGQGSAALQTVGRQG